ncbi:Hypothetical protein PBPRB1203 [Photobacterium profundum SS9]|uniref:Uncharacterized protein n=1 Tax=Photobacterium profundum (strain SS9) TaxID=298386 RepID=Q6LI05_PHOPR|nr:Hypothetical protein PBPRB1203 [Photobacterium profundum SS9]
MTVITSNISCTTANSPSALNSIPKLRSKTCQLDVFVITDTIQLLKIIIQRKTLNNSSPLLFCDSLNGTHDELRNCHLKRLSKR